MRGQKLELLRNLVSLSFVDISNENWINCRKVQLVVSRSIEHAVTRAESVESILRDDSLSLLFEELTEHQAAKDYMRYLFTDLLNTTNFYLESIAEKAIEDTSLRRSIVERRMTSSIAG